MTEWYGQHPRRLGNVMATLADLNGFEMLGTDIYMTKVL
jgi:hypothetical protein